MKKAILIVVLGLLLSGNGYAGTYYCQGALKIINVEKSLENDVISEIKLTIYNENPDNVLTVNSFGKPDPEISFIKVTQIHLLTDDDTILETLKFPYGEFIKHHSEKTFFFKDKNIRYDLGKRYRIDCEW